MPKVVIHINRLDKAVRRELKNRLNDAGREIVAKIKKNISTSYPPASQPWDFPHRRTGRLQKGLRFQVHRGGMWLKVRNIAEHAVYLETGTKWMWPRPHAMRTVKQMMPRLRQVILQGKGRKGNPGFKF